MLRKLIKFCKIILIVVIFVLNEVNGDDETLIFSQILCRHGVRAPINFYKNDPFKNESYWPSGYGGLTEIGKLGQHELGEFLRRRYKNFLSEKFNGKELHVLSSDYDRNIISAQALLTGLYNSKSNLGNLDTNEIRWELFPVHTIPAEYDSLIQPKGYFIKKKNVYTCPKYNKLSKDVGNRPEWAKITADNLELFNGFKNISGEEFRTISDISQFVDTIRIEDMHNYPIPTWAKETLSNQDSLKILSSGFKGLTLTDEMKRLAAGPLMAKFIQNMKNKISPSEPEIRKMYIYQGHDLILSAMMDTLGLFEKYVYWIDFSNAFLMDLYLDNSTSIDQHIVKVSYRNTSKADPVLMTIPGCEDPCTLEKFEEITRKYLPKDLFKECQIDEADSNNATIDPCTYSLSGFSVTNYILSAIIMVLFLVLIGLLAYYNSWQKNIIS